MTILLYKYAKNYNHIPSTASTFEIHTKYLQDLLYVHGMQFLAGKTCSIMETLIHTKYRRVFFSLHRYQRKLCSHMRKYCKNGNWKSIVCRSIKQAPGYSVTVHIQYILYHYLVFTTICLYMCTTYVQLYTVSTYLDKIITIVVYR